MDLLAWLLLLLGGGVAGFVAGCFGLGSGAALFVPVLLLSYRAAGVSALVATHLALGTGLLAVALLAAATAFRCSREGSVAWKTALPMGAAAVAGAVAGALLAGALQEKTLKRIFGALVLLAAVQLFAERRKPKDRPEPPLMSVRLAAAGAVAGLLAALSGTGGGMLTQPLLYSYAHLPLKKAGGTSALVVAAAALAGALGYVLSGAGEILLPPGTTGYVDPLRALPLILGAVPLSVLGARRAAQDGLATLRKLAGVVLVIVALALLVAP